MSITTSPSGRKTFFSTQNPFEIKFGYHRAVRKGPFIFVSGSTAVDPISGEVQGKGDVFAQTLAAMGRCQDAVERLGGTLSDVLRVRMYVKNWDETGTVGRAFKECFGGGDGGEIGAAATMIVVKDGFVDGDMLVEVEVDAVVW